MDVWVCFGPFDIYSDITTLGSSTALDVKSGLMQPVESCDIVIGGTECDNYSSLNYSTQAPESGVLASGSGKSGTTLEGYWGYIKAKRPRVVLWENSDRTRPADLDHLTSLLWRAGYIVSHGKIDAKELLRADNRTVTVCFVLSLAVKVGKVGGERWGKQAWTTSYKATFF